MIILQTNYEQYGDASSKNIDKSRKSTEKQETAVASASFQSVLDDLLNQSGGAVTHTNHNTGVVTNGSVESKPVDHQYNVIPSSTTSVNVTSVVDKTIGTHYRGWTPSNPIERNQLWNRIAQEHPDALKSNVTNSQGYDNLREAQAADIREKLRALGVDMMTSAIIASREVATTVRRPDGSIPGYGASGYHSMPSSIKSTAVSGDSLAHEGVGYAYVNRYGKTQVVRDLARALDYTADGKVFEYTGYFGGGYAFSSSFVPQQLSLANDLQKSENQLFSYHLRLMTDSEINRMAQFAKRS